MSHIGSISCRLIPQLPHSGRVQSHIHPLAFVLVMSLAATLGCSEDAESPTGPGTGPALATTSAHALAFYQVSGGSVHTCGVTTDNRVYCWGANDYGQLGDGTTAQRLTPVAVAGTLRFREVSAGGWYTCGVTTNNRAYCWGFGGGGALGVGTTTNRLTPVPVTGGRLFRRLDASEYHTCGVTYPDNKAYCWGYNGLGELGDGTNTTRLVPTAVTGGRQFRQVNGGQHHTCGVTTSDEAFCWGWNRFGQLGDSSTASLRLTPSRVAGTRRFRQVDAGASFTCAVTTSDRAFCWGNGRQGQVGNGKAYLSFWPRAVAGGLSFERVTTGASHTCGETTDNRAYCWGYNVENGAVGDGTKTMRLTPVPVAGGRFFSQVSAGDNHTCGRTSTAVAYCWGSNGYGQLGEGTTTDRLTPVPVGGS
jgi:alpha-tubulin suppressor-like RCC1 family protein